MDPIQKRIRRVLAGKLAPETLLVLQYVLSFVGRISDRNELVQITNQSQNSQEQKGALGDLARSIFFFFFDCARKKIIENF